ncbi:MAG: sn-glycerol-3-phosphate ABC transporter ATP-binding protein UgpC [Clostridia bacterium]|nr:sn-glycerol-3-phosphate ABC transporter ATP-binding protein UgpC [Clostridia bacterium]
MAEVKLTNVKKIYDHNVVAVHDFNLTIRDQEFVVFVGPSGCGKSTTLRMIAGLEDISEGTLEIDGEVVNDLQPKDRDIAMVFQNYALYPHMTVFDNIAFSLRLKKTPEDEVYERVTRAAEILGITEYLMRKPRALSGGQRQRVAIGRAIVRDPKVFLMDEPLSNLDAKLRNQMRAEIILLRQKMNTTFVYVTHDQTEAMTLGDRIVIMQNGYIEQVGTPEEVFDRPRNLFVAGFIGSPQMNFFQAALERDGDGYAVSLHGHRVRLEGDRAELLKKHGAAPAQIVLGVRPEHLTICDGSDPDAIDGEIRVNEMMGSELHLHVRCGDDKNIILRVPTIELSQEKRESLKTGAHVRFTFSSKVAQIFDPKTENSLLWD